MAAAAAALLSGPRGTSGRPIFDGQNDVYDPVLNHLDVHQVALLSQINSAWHARVVTYLNSAPVRERLEIPEEVASVPAYLQEHGSPTLEIALRKMREEIEAQGGEAIRDYEIRMPLDPGCGITGRVLGVDGAMNLERPHTMVVTSRLREPHQDRFYTRQEMNKDISDIWNAIRGCIGLPPLPPREENLFQYSINSIMRWEGQSRFNVTFPPVSAIQKQKLIRLLSLIDFVRLDHEAGREEIEDHIRGHLTVESRIIFSAVLAGAGSRIHESEQWHWRINGEIRDAVSSRTDVLHDLARERALAEARVLALANQQEEARAARARERLGQAGEAFGRNHLPAIVRVGRDIIGALESANACAGRRWNQLPLQLQRGVVSAGVMTVFLLAALESPITVAIVMWLLNLAVATSGD